MSINRRDLLKQLGLGAAGALMFKGCGSGPGLLDDEILEAGGSVSVPLKSGRPMTRLSTEYGLKYPFASAGMAFYALEDLVVAVSEAGGMGMLGATPEPPDFVQVRIQRIKTRTAKPFGVDFVHGTSSAMGPFTVRAHIDVCIQEQVPLVVFHWNPPPMEWVQALHSAGARVWTQCDSLDMADNALSAGCDGIVAQGTEAGGHNRATIKRIRLFQDIKRELQPPLLLASGGIADAASAALALRLGADGVWVGTRMVASAESYAHPEMKRRIVATQRRERDSVITTMFGPEWPDAPTRVLRNRVVDEWAGREDEIPSPPPPPATIGTTVLFPGIANVPQVMPKFSALPPTRDTVGDFEEMDLAAGSVSASLVQEIQPAGDIVDTMMLGAGALLAPIAK